MAASVSPIADILQRVRSYLPAADFARIAAAYQLAATAHADQKRFSGELYITHPVAAARILLELQPDEDTLIACLLHDVVEDTPVTLAEIEQQFGPTVARLTAGMEKIGKVRYHGEERQIENLRKMFVAMATDIRVIFIKLADRIHNMQTLGHVRPDKQQRIAQETLMIYAPIAARLGIFPFKKQLEDLAFRYLEPAKHAELTRQLQGSEAERQRLVEAALTKLQTIFTAAGLKVELKGRTKHAYSVWKKLEKKGYGSLDEIYDLFALRVLVATPAECYAALGVIHQHFRPLSHRFKDYIAVPKNNGYQSLHTTVMGLTPDQPTEIQIRTRAMHAAAERGAAAHWQYSEKKQSVAAGSERLGWVQNLVELTEHLDNKELVESLSTDVLTDRIFVLTPRGDVLDLPAGATPVDFAYAVHTAVGNRCVGAKVDGKIAPLDSPLRSNQVVEILTRKDATPNRFWLSFARSENTRSKIKAYFNALDRAENVAAGKEMLNAQLVRLGQKPLDAEYSLLKKWHDADLSKRGRESVLERIGNGSITAASVAHVVCQLSEPPPRRAVAAAAAGVRPTVTGEVVIAGERGLPYVLAKCCNPHPGQPITAFLNPQRGATVHAADCRQLARSNPARKLPARWLGEVGHELVYLTVGARDRLGLTRDLATAIAAAGANILKIATSSNHRYASNHYFVLEVESLEKLAVLLEKMTLIDGVENVERLKKPAAPKKVEAQNAAEKNG